MKLSVIIFIGFVCAVSSQRFESNTCVYYSSNNDVYYGLANFNGWINYTTTAGDVWYVNPCPDFSYYSSPCPEGSSICLISNGVLSIRGLVNGSVFSDSVEGSSKGVEIMEATNEPCTKEADDGNYKTVVEFICESEQDHWTVIVEECVVTLNIHTSNACPLITYDGPGFEDHPVERVVVIPWLFMLLSALAFIACMCCCCCASRRRRCQQAKKIQMQQFSNVAFQPIPSTQQSKTVSSTLPSFNPYVAQPQYFYYYPTQQAQAQQPIVPLESMSVASSDEIMAKELQAQYDRESQV